MKRHPLLLLLSIVLACVSINVNAQVSKLKYRLVHNDTTQLVDFYIHITQGTSKTAAQRAQFNAQVSVVVNDGTALSVVKTYMPLKDNQTYNGTIPSAWTIANYLLNWIEMPGKDLYSITPGTLGTFYNDLYPGDSVRLFSLLIQGGNLPCESEIRLFENGEDPKFDFASDFSNGFTIGGASQDYDGNLPMIEKQRPEITSVQFQKDSINRSISVAATASSPLTYEWTGPLGITSSSPVLILPDSSIYDGIYTLKITELGCQYETNFIIESPIVQSCSNGIYTLSSNFGAGHWSAFAHNPSPVAVTETSSTTTDVKFGNAIPGMYHFIFTNENGATIRKFIEVVVDSSAKASILDVGPVCFDSDAVLLQAGPAGGVFYGVGIANNYFYPFLTSPGIHTIGYIFDNGKCRTIDETEIIVYESANAGWDKEVCAGSIVPLNGSPVSGIWKVVNDNGDLIVQQANNGNSQLIIDDNAEGQYQLVYYTASSGSCFDTMELLVKPRPDAIMEKNYGCLGETLTGNLKSNVPGSWVSSNTAVAITTKLNNTSSNVTGLNLGTATFTFTSSVNGCSVTTEKFTVQSYPSIPQADFMCAGETKQRQGGNSITWASSNLSVATIDTNGLITGLQPGTTVIQATNNFGCTSIMDLIISQKAVLTLSGDGSLCVGETEQINSTISVGSWISSNNAILTVTNSGLVTAVGFGVTDIVQYTNAGCASDPITILVSTNKYVVNGIDKLCPGKSVQIFPGKGSGFYSNDTTIASVDSNGVITALAPGSTFILCQPNDKTCLSDTMIQVNIKPSPEIQLLGDSIACVGESLSLTSNSFGIWKIHSVSQGIFPATINNSGVVTCVLPGKTKFVFTRSSDGCESKPSPEITVLASPLVSFIGNDSICPGQTIQLSPSTGGSWLSMDPSIAIEDGNGRVTGLKNGKARFRFYENQGNCQSEIITIWVIEQEVKLPSDGGCPGSAVILSPTSGGHWSSSDASIAYVSNKGVVSPLKPGKVRFTFTSHLGPDCIINDATTPEWTVYTQPVLNEPPSITLLKGDEYQLNFQSQATIVVSNQNVLEIDQNSRKIKAIKNGKSDVYLKTGEGCSSEKIEVNVVNEYAKIVKGVVYADYDNNGIFDLTDAPLPNFLVYEKGSQKYDFTNQNGAFQIVLSKANAEVVIEANYGQWEQDIFTHPVQFTSAPIQITQAFVPTLDNEDVHVKADLLTSWLRCSSIVNLHTAVKNESSFPINGTMVVETDSRAPFHSFYPYTGIQTGNILRFEFNQLKPGKFFDPDIKITVPQPQGISDSLFFKLTILDESGKVVEVKHYGELIRCSYDPNDKMALPSRAGDRGPILWDETIQYTIRFQNTGNDTAFYVEIVDALDEALDPQTLKVISASHEVEVKIDKNLVRFIFGKIILPDSATNAIESQGYVSFDIQSEPGLSHGYELDNTAKIIFDFNEPIITNTVKNALVEYLPCTDIAGHIAQDGKYLVAPEGGQEYHWFDCSTFEEVFVSHENLFVPEYVNEFFAIVHGENCRYTTDCYGYVLTGTNEVKESDIIIYPNPAAEKITIISQTNFETIGIYDITGKKVKILPFNHNLNIDDLVRGYYVLEFRTSNGFLVKKSFIKNSK